MIMEMMKTIKIMAAASALLAFAGCVEEQATEMTPAPAPGIRAVMENPEVRTSVDLSGLESGKVIPVLWNPGDALGAYTDGGSANVLYMNDEQSEDVPNASFSTSESVKGDISYVYYPYDSANDGNDAASLEGTLPSVQAMDGGLYGDYKYGVLKERGDDGSCTFKFHNIFSMVMFRIDASGTAIIGETLEDVTLTITRGGETIPVCGDFTFSAVDGSYELGETSDELVTTWNQPLEGVLTGVATILPEVKSGDKFNFTFRTTNYEANLTVTSRVDFAPGAYYTLPLTLAKFSKLETVKTGTFTAATYNVDGLPTKISFITINGDGPGSSGTKTISSTIAADNWDFIGFSEDFAYHSELIGSLSGNYTFGKYRGSVGASALVSTIDTDGLGFATRNTSCSFSNETVVQFTSSSGGLDSGANTCIKKGFRHYVVTLKDGTELDVIITHMNTYSSSGTGHINAQHAQLKQVAQYINSIRTNKRPIIFMGDTNCRYTRHDFQTYFWSVLDSDLEVHDPWVDYQWEGVYPTYPSKSLMVSDATGTNSETDIICPDTQQGEVVDKVIYINNPDAATKIKANSYLRDYDGYNGLSDHMPIVVEFSYTKTL